MATAKEKTAGAEENLSAQEPDVLSPEYWEEPVKVELPRIGADGRGDVPVSVNGETIRIQRGVPVQIKRKFAEALRLAAVQEREAAANAEAAARRGRKPIAEM